MLIVNPFCCCSLKTGGMIFGFLEIIGGCIATITSLIPLGLGLAINKRELEVTAIGLLLVYLAAIWLIIGVLYIFFGIILLYAIQQESTYRLKLWIMFQAILLILSIGLSVPLFAIAFTWQKLILGFIGTLLSLWFISVVYYLRKEITWTFDFHS